MDRIFPRNLTALAAMQVTGNPVNTRLESGVGNCYPGLEFDQRNLDRRFFPGLVFEYSSAAKRDADLSGAHLVEVDPSDPDLSPLSFSANPNDRPDAATQSALSAELNGDTGTALREGSWFLSSITQQGRTISMDGDDGMRVWRFVRTLQPGAVSIKLVRREGEGAAPKPIVLDGWRRTFTASATGTLSPAYAAGEMTQSLCSPWMHDFRDCACYYWASNHPDIVLSEQQPGETTLPDGESDDPEKANTPIDWLRADRAPERTAAALGDFDLNRPAQLDHYQINQSWQDLSIVLLGREQGNEYRPRPTENATPFSTPDLLAAELVRLATLEHTVALEYLYARYSVRNPKPNESMFDELTFVRHELLLIAVGEMRHLRWANQLLWELDHRNLTSKRFGPSLGLIDTLPADGGKVRPRQLRPLTAAVLDDFIAVEAPSGTLDGEYAEVVSTLRDQRKYPQELVQLAERIIADGMEHYSRFREIRITLQPFLNGNPPAYLTPVTPAPAANVKAQHAVAAYQQILADLAKAYAKGDAEDFGNLAAARAVMFQLDDLANQLAAEDPPLGVPYF
jgi:Ferritin-like